MCILKPVVVTCTCFIIGEHPTDGEEVNHCYNAHSVENDGPQRGDGDKGESHEDTNTSDITAPTSAGVSAAATAASVPTSRSYSTPSSLQTPSGGTIMDTATASTAGSNGTTTTTTTLSTTKSSSLPSTTSGSHVGSEVQGPDRGTIPCGATISASSVTYQSTTHASSTLNILMVHSTTATQSSKLHMCTHTHTHTHTQTHSNTQTNQYTSTNTHST